MHACASFAPVSFYFIAAFVFILFCTRGRLKRVATLKAVARGFKLPLAFTAARGICGKQTKILWATPSLNTLMQSSVSTKLLIAVKCTKMYRFKCHISKLFCMEQCSPPYLEKALFLGAPSQNEFPYAIIKSLASPLIEEDNWIDYV